MWRANSGSTSARLVFGLEQLRPVQARVLDPAHPHEPAHVGRGAPGDARHARVAARQAREQQRRSPSGPGRPAARSTIGASVPSTSKNSAARAGSALRGRRASTTRRSMPRCAWPPSPPPPARSPASSAWAAARSSSRCSCSGSATGIARPPAPRSPRSRSSRALAAAVHAVYGNVDLVQGPARGGARGRAECSPAPPSSSASPSGRWRRAFVVLLLASAAVLVF